MLLKRQLTIIGLLTLGAMLCVTATVQSFRRTMPMEEGLPAVEKKYTSFDTAAYIVREQNGYVAVFSSNPSQLLEVTAIPVGTLPKADRALLGRGIAAADRQALLTLLEDLNS